MKKTFYSHLISYDSIMIELDKMNLAEEEKLHLISIVDSTLHHAILDSILSHLSFGDKQTFLTQIVEGEDDQIWEFLNKRVDTIEEKIRKTADDLQGQLHRDIKESHNRGK